MLLFIECISYFIFLLTKQCSGVVIHVLQLKTARHVEPGSLNPSWQVTEPGGDPGRLTPEPAFLTQVTYWATLYLTSLFSTTFLRQNTTEDSYRHLASPCSASLTFML